MAELKIFLRDAGNGQKPEAAAGVEKAAGAAGKVTKDAGGK